MYEIKLAKGIDSQLVCRDPRAFRVSMGQTLIFRKKRSLFFYVHEAINGNISTFILL